MIHRYVQRDRKKILSHGQMLSVIVAPLFTEKSTRQSEHRQYFFKVASWANKFDIARAVSSIFSVDVEKVTTVSVRPSVRRFRGRQGTVSGYKKAMVSVKSGQSIDLVGEAK